MALTSPGFALLPSLPERHRSTACKIFIFIFTYLCYAGYHIAKKPLSVVKDVLHQNCSREYPAGKPDHMNYSDAGNWCSWPPFDKSNYGVLLGSLDYCFLTAYAIGLFISGHVAERMNVRHFLVAGMVSNAVCTAALGLSYFIPIHNLAYFLLFQTLAGLASSTGWPALVSCMGNWFGRNKRGVIMGTWASTTSLGSILGAVLAGVFVETAWGLCFLLPALILVCLAVLTFLFLTPRPEDVGLACPHKEEKESSAIPICSDVNCDDGKSPAVGTRTSETSNLLERDKASNLTIPEALRIPGVLEFSLCLCFVKFVSYAFLFWLPYYIKEVTQLSPERAADLSTLFDVGAVIGGTVVGLLSDCLEARALICGMTILVACPAMYVYSVYGSQCLSSNILLLLVTGALVNGPYGVISTAVATDLGSHPSLKDNSRAFATVAAIIDGTGSVGAAFGPFLTGVFSQSGWQDVFYMLIVANLLAALLLVRLIAKDVKLLLGRKRYCCSK